MIRARRSFRSSIRWTSRAICLALVVSSLALHDGTRYNFEYVGTGQVNGDHPFEEGITKEIINYNQTTDFFISEEVKKLLDETC